MVEYEPIIGLEVHVQLATASKLFCGCSTEFGQPPNSAVCPVCTGQPGVLPVLNQQAVAFALKLAVALNCRINQRSRFARKNYFYPDLPKGYQISQYEQPIAEHGILEIATDEGKKPIGITRIHIEEDAGKSLHHGGMGSRVDLNRAGVPLVEVVSEPEIETPSQAASYMRAMRSVVRTLNISDGNLEEGSLRCDANVSLRRVGTKTLGTKTEIKNINSFRFVQKALVYEIGRQRNELQDGRSIVQETRLWDADTGTTESMRSKEEAHDYRYFPDPDLPPLIIQDEEVERVRSQLSELPLARQERFVSELRLGEQLAAELNRERELADYFEAVVQAGAPAKRAANWITTELLSKVIDPRDVSSAAVSPAALAELLGLIESGRVSSKLAKEIWHKMWSDGRSALEIAEAEDLFQQSDTGAIEAIVIDLVNKNADKVEQFHQGKEKVLGWFVGQVMQQTRGKANPQVVNQLLRKHLAVGAS